MKTESTGACPSENTIAELVDGALDRGQTERLHGHLAECDTCRSVLLGMVAALPPEAAQSTRASEARALSTSVGPDGSPVPSWAPDLPLALVESDRYVARREIARGGMGRILEAWDTRHQRRVALKILLRADARSSWRFVREARITARLQHPAIVPLYEAGRWTDGEPFFAMKLVEGRSLHDAIRRTSTLEERIRLLRHLVAVTEAVAFAHAHGVVHRDLKPHNVLLGEYGETVVVDWGLAKEVGDDHAGEHDPAAPGERSDLEAGLTAAGGTLGTPCYMPPEQARGEPIDARADVYAIGAMLYDLFCGAPPHVGKTGAETVAQVLAGPPHPIAARVPDLPRDLAALVEKAMARDKTERYATAAEMASDLRRFEAGQLVSAHTYTATALARRWVSRHRAVVGMTGLLVLLVGITAGLGVRRVVRERDRASVLAQVAERERSAAVTQREAAEQLIQFMIDDVNDRLEAAGHMSLMAGLAGEVDDYYRKTATGDASLSAATLSRRATALATLARFDAENHDAAGARRLSHESLALRERVLALDPDDENAVVAVSHSHVSIGFSELNLGHFAEAAAELERGLAVTARLTSRDPPSSAARSAAAEVTQFEGYVAMERGDFVGASSHYARTQAELVALLETDPGHDAWKTNLGWARFNLALCAARMGHLEEAERLYSAAIEVRRELAARDPENVQSQSNLASSWEYLGRLEASEGRLAPALDALRSAIEIDERLVEKHPDSAERMRNLTSSVTARTDVAIAMGRIDDALASARRHMELTAELLRRAPDDVMFQDERSEAFLALGTVELARGRMADARSALRSGLTLGARTAEDSLTFFEKLTRVKLLRMLAQVDVASRDYRSAADAVDRARRLAERIETDAPDDGDAKQRLGETLETAGDVALGERRLEAATDLYSRALGAFDRMRSPRPPEAELGQAMARWKLGGALRSGGHGAQARSAIDAASTTVAALETRGALGRGQLEAWRALTSRR